MDLDESKIISEKSRIRATDSIIKDGYMNGAADGQSSTFQDSFDLGYEQGLNFGFSLGFKDAYTNNRDNKQPEQNVNCQICLKTTELQQDVANLYNIQRESNETYLQ